jgi:hypothetical protein
MEAKPPAKMEKKIPRITRRKATPGTRARGGGGGVIEIHHASGCEEMYDPLRSLALALSPSKGDSMPSPRFADYFERWL